MAYTIRYSPENNKKYPTDKPPKKSLLIFAVVMFTAVSLLLVNDGVRDVIADFVLPGDLQVTKSAIVQLVEDVRTGEPVANAITTFCQYVIDHA